MSLEKQDPLLFSKSILKFIFYLNSVRLQVELGTFLLCFHITLPISLLSSYMCSNYLLSYFNTQLSTLGSFDYVFIHFIFPCLDLCLEQSLYSINISLSKRLKFLEGQGCILIVLFSFQW